MPIAILINGLTPPITNLAIGTTVTLTNQNNAGVTTWAWALLDRPPGSTAFLSTPTLSSTNITLDLEGTYLFQLVVNGLVLTPVTAIGAIPTLLSGLRLPAAGEQREDDSNRGWTTSLNANMTSIEDMVYTGSTIMCMTDGARNHGQAVCVTGETTLVNGVKVPTVTTVNALTTAANTVLGVLVQSTAGAALAAVRTSGEITEFTVDTTGRQVGDKVYLANTNSGAPNSGFSFISGTHTSLLGRVSTVGSGGRIVVQLDNNPDSPNRINVLDYGAKADYRTSGATVSITISTSNVSSSSPLWATSDVGKIISIPGAGSGGHSLVGTITTFTDSQHIVIGTTAVATATNVVALIGTDNTAPFNLAFATSNSIGNVYAGSVVGLFYMPTVFVPAGLYLFGSGMGAVGATRIRGDDAILIAGSETLDFMTLPYTHTVEGLQFVNGRTGITIANGNVGEDVYIRHCWFDQQAVYGIGSDAFSQSTGIRIDDCHFDDNNLATGACMAFQSGDYITCTDCQLVSARTYFVTLSGCVMNVQGMLAAPNNPAGAWFRVDTGSLLCYGIRFGGEFGGKVPVEWHSPPQFINGGAAYVPTMLVIEDCFVYSTTYFVKFYNVPGWTRIRGNAGDNGTFYFDPSIPVGVRQQISGLLVADVRGNFPRSIVDLTSDAQAATMYTNVLSSDEVLHEDYVTPSQMVLMIPGAAHQLKMGSGVSGWGENAQPTNTSGADSTDIYGDYVCQYTASNPALLMNYTSSYLRGMSGLTPGPYTMYAEVEVIGGMAAFGMGAAGATNFWTLPQGRHVLPLKFWHSYSNLTAPLYQNSHAYSLNAIVTYSKVGANGPTTIWRVKTAGTTGSNPTFLDNLQVGDTQVPDGTVMWEFLEELAISLTIQTFGTTQIRPGAFRIFSGHFNHPQGWRTEALSPTIPTAGVFRVGDVIKNSSPAPGGVMGWVVTAGTGYAAAYCSAAYSAVWSTSTGFTYGQFVLNGSTVYMCTQTGTSAGAGPGPTGNAGIQNIADGTCFWNAVSNSVAQFNEYGAISF